MRAFLFFLMSSTLSWAQQKPFYTIRLASPVQHAYVDRPGDLYLQYTTGTIQKFDIDGKLLAEFKPAEELALFEPRDGARAFCYHSKTRWYSFAYFGNLNKLKLNEEFAIQPVLACSSGDKNLWVLDRADNSLRKINTERLMVDVEVELPAELQSEKTEIPIMREYQNFLFLLDRQSGIYIFNAIGNHLKTIAGNNITYFNFLGEEMYYPQQGKLIFYDLFDTSTRETRLDPAVKIVLLTDVRTFSVYEDRVEIFLVDP